MTTSDKIDKLMAAYYAETGTEINETSSVRFHIGSILSRHEHLVNNPHSESGFRKYTDDMAKIQGLAKIKKIVFYSATGKVETSSDVLISVIDVLLRETNVPAPKTGRNRNEAMRMSLKDIIELQNEGVPVDFIASLFGNNPEAFRRQLSRIKKQAGQNTP
jgi:hypothetical protein